MEQKAFTPTDEQIKIAQLLFIARAYLAEAKEEFKKMEREILNSGNYHYDDCWYADNIESGKYPADRILRDPDYTFLMKGVELVDKPGYENTEACRFDKELNEKAIKAGYRHARKAASIASSAVDDLENKLLDINTHIYGISHTDFTDMSIRKGMIKLIQNTFRHVVYRQDAKALTFQFLKEHLTDQAITRLTTFTSSEASFKKFKALREYVPMEDFPVNTVAPLDESIRENVEGIYYYVPQFYLYKMKPACSMQFQGCPPTTRQFVFINHKNELNEGNNFPIAERELFYQFINQTTAV